MTEFEKLSIEEVKMLPIREKSSTKRNWTPKGR